jgi:hypothetical protein
VEEGTHAELIAAGGLYRRLYDEQVAGAVVDESATVAPGPVSA